MKTQKRIVSTLGARVLSSRAFAQPDVVTAHRFPVAGALVAALSLALPVWLSAQTAPAASSAAASDQPTIRLNPFEVSEQTDNSFTTQAVGTGSRMPIDLKDLPAMYSVINRNFIDALGITDLTEAASWAPGQSFDVGTTTTLGNTEGQTSRFLQRGLTQTATPNAGNSFGGATGTQRNFYQNPGAGYQDSYSVESYDFGQGPNGILFGGSNSPGGAGNSGAQAAGLAGTSSIQSKKARFDRSNTTIAAEIGNWDYRRVTIDYNRPLSERIGIRVNAVDLDSKAYVDNGTNLKRGLNITTTFKLTPTSELSVEVSYDKARQHNPNFPNENISGWDGSTVARGLIDSTMIPGTTNNNPASLSKSYGSILGTSTPLSFGGEPNGVTRLTNNANFYFWETGSDTIMNMRGMLVTRRANATSRTPLWSSTAPNGAFFVQGTRPSTISNGVSVSTDVGFGVSNRSWLNLTGLPLDMYQRAAANSRFKPWGPRENFSYTGAGQTNTSRDLQFSYAQSFGNNLAFGLGGDWNNNIHTGTEIDRDLNTVKLDINQLLPDGSPNPHFLEPFAETRSFVLPDGISSERQHTVDQALRANIAYNLNKGKWGKYSFNINGNLNVRTFDFDLTQMGMTSAPNDPVLKTVLLDPRTWATQGAVNMLMYQSSNRGYTEVRKPASFNLVNTQWTGTGTEGDTNAFVPTVNKSTVSTGWVRNVSATPAPPTLQFFRQKNLAVQMTAKWLDEKIVFVGAARRDGNSAYTRQSLAAQYYPTIDDIQRPTGTVVPGGRWDGLTSFYKPQWTGTAEQYYALSYKTRDANGNQVGTARLAASRPTTTLPGGKDGGNLNGSFVVMDPRYAADKFRDDYSPPTITNYGVTKTYGVTLNPVRWFSPFINHSDQFIPSTVPATGGNVNVDMFGRVQDPITAKGTDFGARFSFLGGKVSGKYNYFNTIRYNSPASNAVITNINTLINANRWDDANTAQGAGSAINQLGIAPLNNNPDYQTLSNFGYEWELSVQPIRALRLTLNGGAGSNGVDQSTLYPLTRRYMDTPDRIAEFKGLLEDAGGSLDTTQKPVSNGRQVAIAPGLAVLTPLPGKGVGLDTTSAVNAYNNIWIQYDQLFTNNTRNRNTPTANFFGDYTFQSGMLSGLRVGAGVQWQGVRSLGNKANWTVLANDPTLGVVAVDDPNYNNTDIIWAPGNLRSQANLAYTFKLKDNRSLALALRINNIGGHQFLYGAVSRQPQGDLTKPNRVTLRAGNVTSFNEPINFRLTATYTFGNGGR